MLNKTGLFLKVFAKSVAVGILTGSAEASDKEQIRALSNGVGGVFVDGEEVMTQEALDMQARGELYNQWNR
jgi:hypothetical protein